ncbi:phosphopantetheinyl transferase [Plectosphaerella plurivora]|uniref:holo-[acyl-carrier-protein] synthase n=1 Tax=Plectosphaerella plurivora TaxID=936078 RepID=A0A9P8VPT5_9PEZI|nr:phosphopantetheinyl transferase [Plectosphaerella plurivora]
MAQQQPVIIQWVVDTRPLWPNASKTKDLEQAAARALALLTTDERVAVLRYYHVRDAKLSLASHLLKRLAIARYCRVPWREAAPVRDSAHSKPVWRDPAGREPLCFNVSHQAGIVALFAVADYPGPGRVDVGVDVVCPPERRDRDVAMLASDGWERFVDIHSDVFGPREVEYLKTGIKASSSLPGRPGPGASPVEVADFRLRCFYALWCLREAYIKMTGEALMAPWLRDLEFKGFRPPADEADIVSQHEIYLHGQSVKDANVCLRALGSDFMISAAVRTSEAPKDGLGFRLGSFESIDMDELLGEAEAAGGL